MQIIPIDREEAGTLGGGDSEAKPATNPKRHTLAWSGITFSIHKQTRVSPSSTSPTRDTGRVGCGKAVVSQPGLAAASREQE